MEQAAVLHLGTLGLSPVVDLLFEGLCRSVSWCAENARRRAKLEVSSSSFVSLCDQWAVAWLNKISQRKKRTISLQWHLKGLLARRTVENAGLVTDRGREGRE